MSKPIAHSANVNPCSSWSKPFHKSQTPILKSNSIFYQNNQNQPLTTIGEIMKNTFKQISTVTILALSLITTNAAAADKSSEGKELAEMSFESVKRADRDFVDMGEMEIFRDSLFFSMDQDDNLKLTFDEFFEWDYGFKRIAEETGKQKEYLTAMKIMFAFWDLNGDGNLSETEHRRALIRDFQRADLDNNAVLSKPEFFGAFSMNIAFKAALKD